MHEARQAEWEEVGVRNKGVSVDLELRESSELALRVLISPPVVNRMALVLPA